ncbi:hypothetical protein BRADI_2g59143v3, partial [Brachypodium distachyon]
MQCNASMRTSRSLEESRHEQRSLINEWIPVLDLRGLSISSGGKILSRRINRLTLKQQRLITLAIKQARILSFLPFRNYENEKQFQAQSISIITGSRPRKNRHIPQLTQKYSSNRN